MFREMLRNKLLRKSACDVHYDMFMSTLIFRPVRNYSQYKQSIFSLFYRIKVKIRKSALCLTCFISKQNIYLLFFDCCEEKCIQCLLLNQCYLYKLLKIIYPFLAEKYLRSFAFVMPRHNTRKNLRYGIPSRFVLWTCGYIFWSKFKYVISVHLKCMINHHGYASLKTISPLIVIGKIQLNDCLSIKRGHACLASTWYIRLNYIFSLPVRQCLFYFKRC